MPGSRSSRPSRASKAKPRGGSERVSAPSPGGWAPAAAVWAAALLLGALFAWWHAVQGYSYYYGDAEAHLDIARHILDTRTRTLENLGTVWLPLPHLLMLPLVGNDAWWRNGLAGAVPSVLCFSLAVLLLFLLVRRLTGSTAAGMAAAAVFASNPNLLYLQSTAMTEAVYAACSLGTLYALVRASEGAGLLWPAVAGVAALAGALTRYEGWFLLPFYALYLLLASGRPRWGAAALFCAIAGLGPLAWLAHNWWWWGDTLEFYRGEWSARAIYERALRSGMKPAPGDGDWRLAFLYFTSAIRAVCGTALSVLGGLAMAACMRRRLAAPLALLLLAPLFYIWSLHSAGLPIFLPELWPNSYYNTRYALAALPALALGCGALVALAPGVKLRGVLLAGVVCLAVLPWAVYPRAGNWICWKESQVNSAARRRWSGELAGFLKTRYRGGGIAMSFGDARAALRQAGIPLREAMHEGSGVLWYAALARPELFLREEWVITLSGDKLANALPRGERRGLRYDCQRTIVVEGAPVVQVWRLSSRLRPPEFAAPEEEQRQQFEKALREVP
ncbi:MAG: glycosyltransferase family 39 protein [Bryobacterales bacterium]|nr:glycosyltransferase family 39 protein [Bryobacterales bacterium]